MILFIYFTGIGPDVTTLSDLYLDKMDLFSTSPVESYLEYFREST